MTDEKFLKYVKALKDWREEDHNDSIVLSRHEVCVLLDGINNLTARR